MKLIRFGDRGAERPGVLAPDGTIRDLSDHVSDLHGEALSPASLRTLRELNSTKLPKIDAGVRLGPCVAGVGKLIGIGLNYSDHAAESGMPVPIEPPIFFKATSAISGPNDDVMLPRGSEKTDWEVELGVVIGTRARYVAEQEAMDYVAGFCIINDVSERSYQLERGGQWSKGKGCDTFAPIGPWLVTRDEVRDPHALKMTLDVNGTRRQNGSTSTMIFRVPFLVSYVSEFMTLEPGDLISTGTPPGVGLGQKPPVFLRDGDIMELEVEGLGRQRQRVAPFRR